MRYTRVFAMVAGVAAIAATTATAPQAVAAPASASASGQAEQYIVQFRSGADRGAALRALGSRFGATLTEARQLAIGAHVITVDRTTSGLLKPCRHAATWSTPNRTS